MLEFLKTLTVASVFSASSLGGLPAFASKDQPQDPNAPQLTEAAGQTDVQSLEAGIQRLEKEAFANAERVADGERPTALALSEARSGKGEGSQEISSKKSASTPKETAVSRTPRASVAPVNEKSKAQSRAASKASGGGRPSKRPSGGSTSAPLKRQRPAVSRSTYSPTKNPDSPVPKMSQQSSSRAPRQSMGSLSPLELTSQKLSSPSPKVLQVAPALEKLPLVRSAFALNKKEDMHKVLKKNNRVGREVLEAKRPADEQAAAEKLERERQGQEAAEAKRLADEQEAAEKLERERKEQEAAEAKRLADEQAAAEKLERERQEQEAAEAKRLADEQAAAEKLERERQEQEAAEAKRLADEQAAAEEQLNVNRAHQNEAKEELEESERILEEVQKYSEESLKDLEEKAEKALSDLKIAALDASEDVDQKKADFVECSAKLAAVRAHFSGGSFASGRNASGADAKENRLFERAEISEVAQMQRTLLEAKKRSDQIVREMQLAPVEEALYERLVASADAFKAYRMEVSDSSSAAPVEDQFKQDALKEIKQAVKLNVAKFVRLTPNQRPDDAILKDLENRAEEILKEKVIRLGSSQRRVLEAFEKTALEKSEKRQSLSPLEKLALESYVDKRPLRDIEQKIALKGAFSLTLSEVEALETFVEKRALEKAGRGEPLSPLEELAFDHFAEIETKVFDVRVYKEARLKFVEEQKELSRVLSRKASNALCEFSRLTLEEKKIHREELVEALKGVYLEDATNSKEAEEEAQAEAEWEIFTSGWTARKKETYAPSFLSGKEKLAYGNQKQVEEIL